jgi:hypothetical protein
MRRPHVDVDAGVRHESGVKLAADASREREIVVFWIVRDSVCAECGQELERGRFLRVEAQRALCLACADLDHLVFLERGDAALTRRASRYSTLRAVVVRFSRARKRYERQGVMVEEAALERAERECLADTEARRRVRERATDRRQEHNAEYVAEFARSVGELFPECAVEEQRAIAEHACRKYSGRFGRSAAAKKLQADAIALAVRAHVRHVHTRYRRAARARSGARRRSCSGGGLWAQCLESWQHGDHNAAGEQNGS